MLSALHNIAEQKIQEAMKKGSLNSEKYKNKPLPMEDDRFVPEDLKMSYKILKNSGYLPPEVEERKEVKKLEDLISHTTDEHQRVKQMKKLSVLLMKIESRQGRPLNIANQDAYYGRVVERVTTSSAKK